MLNFLWFFIRPFAWFARLLRKIARTTLGQLSWTPPHWLQRGFVRIHLYRRRRPFLFAGEVFLVLLLASGSLWTWKWYQRQPKPHTVFAQVAPIPITPLDKELRIPPLSITLFPLNVKFAAAAALNRTLPLVASVVAVKLALTSVLFVLAANVLAL